MRKILVLILVSVFCIGTYAAGRKPVLYKDLPKKVQTVVKSNYDQKDIQLITYVRTSPKHNRYQFIVADGTTFEYNDKAELLKATNADGIKDAFVHKEVLKYVKKNFPNATITRYVWQKYRQTVRLNDKMTVIFSKKGKFLRIED